MCAGQPTSTSVLFCSDFFKFAYTFFPSSLCLIPPKFAVFTCKCKTFFCKIVFSQRFNHVVSNGISHSERNIEISSLTIYGSILLTTVLCVSNTGPFRRRFLVEGTFNRGGVSIRKSWNRGCFKEGAFNRIITVFIFL